MIRSGRLVRDLSFEDIATGDEAELTWAVSEDDIDAFVRLSGDDNPMHTDNQWAQSQGFAGRVAHGLLLAAKVSTLVGTMLPGRRCLIADYQFDHPNPVYAGDEITVRGKVKERWPDFSLIEVVVKAVKRVDGKEKAVLRGRVRCKVLP